MNDFVEMPAATNDSSMLSFQLQQRSLHWVQDRIRLLWVYKSFRISKNILRAACDYLRLQFVLVHLRDNQIRYFDVIRKKWKPLCGLSIDLSKSYGLCYTLTMCSINTFVICGGFINEFAAHLIEDGSVRVLPNLIHGRYSHGAVHISLCSKVYLFGGASSGSIRHCESFHLLTWSRQEVAPMHKRRAGINPLLYGYLIYIAGGDRTLTIEVYDWRRNYFTFLPLFESIYAFQVQAVITGDSLLCISEKCNYRIYLRTLQLLNTYPHESIQICSGVSMAISDKVAVFADERRCVLYSLADGMQLSVLEN